MPGKRFTEPVTLSSTVSADFPLSALRLLRTAFGDDFDLLASRARCTQNLLRRGGADQVPRERKTCSERESSQRPAWSTPVSIGSVNSPRDVSGLFARYARMR